MDDCYLETLQGVMGAKKEWKELAPSHAELGSLVLATAIHTLRDGDFRNLNRYVEVTNKMASNSDEKSKAISRLLDLVDRLEILLKEKADV